MPVGTRWWYTQPADLKMEKSLKRWDRFWVQSLKMSWHWHTHNLYIYIYITYTHYLCYWQKESDSINRRIIYNLNNDEVFGLFFWFKIILIDVLLNIYGGYNRILMLLPVVLLENDTHWRVLKSSGLEVIIPEICLFSLLDKEPEGVPW